MENIISLAQQKIAFINSWVLTILIFSLPISTSAASVLSILIILLWFVERNYAFKIKEILSNRLALAILAYVAVFLVGLLWTDNLHWGLKQSRKQWKLLLMFFLLTTARKEHIRYYVGAFVIAMGLSAVLSYLVWFEAIHIPGVNPLYPNPFVDHIAYNPLLAFAIYLLLYYILFEKPAARILWPCVIVSITMIGSMFITSGRSGQAAFFVLITLLLFQLFHRKLLVAALAAAISIPLIFTAAYHTSPAFEKRINMTMEELRDFDQKPKTSTAMRLMFLLNSVEIVKKNPIWGAGTGDFPDEYKRINITHSPTFVSTDDPHNHYLLILTQFGIVGFIIFCSVFYMMFHYSLMIADRFKNIRLAFILFYLTIMFGGTYLLGHTMSIFFAVGSALLYNEKISARPVT